MSQNPGPGYLPALGSAEPYGYPPQQVPGQGAPVPQTWVQQYGTSAPQVHPESYGYSALPAPPYAQPLGAYPAYQGMAGYGLVPAAPVRRQPTLGIVGIAVVAVALVVLCSFMYTWGTLQGQVAPDGNLTDQQTSTILGQVGLGVVLSLLVVFAGWVVGIVATAINRGRAFGIAAIVLGAIAPIIGFGAMVVALIPYE